MRMIKTIALLLLLALPALELAVRTLGLADVPVRRANSTTGYIPLPAQSGRFLLNDWHINDLSMISSRDYNDDGRAIILAGDSVVFGGNPLAQSERIGERLDRMLPSPVYAIADGSWAFKNTIKLFP